MSATISGLDPQIWVPIFAALAVLTYLLPSIIAGMRGHRNLLPVMVVNVLLGWTLVGWAVSLAWSLMAHDHVRMRERRRYARR